MKKKPFSRKTAVLLVMALMCQQVPVQAAKIARVKFSVSDCILSKEDSRNLNVQGMDERSGKYQSRNKKIVTVSKNGIIRAKKAGETQVVWTKGKKKLICSVVVVKKPAVSKPEVTVKEGSSEQVSVKMFGNKGLKVSWKSADPGIALVKGGTITGVAEGMVQVTAKVTGYTKTYLENITVIVEKASEEAAADPVSPMAPVLPGDFIPEDWTGNQQEMNMETPGAVEVPDDGEIDHVNPTVPVPTEPSDPPSVPTGGSVNMVPGVDSMPGHTEEGGTGTENSSSGNAGTPVTGSTTPPPAPDAGNQGNGQLGGNQTGAGSSVTGTEGESDMTQKPDAGNTGDSGNAGDAENTGSAGNTGNSESTGDKAPDEENKQPGESESSQTMAEQVLEIVNQEREKQGLSALTLDVKLTACAELRAEELKEVFLHERPDGTSCFSVLDENNVMYFTCGENIAYGYRTAQSVMNGWMNSAGHRANILNEDFGKIGVGYFKDGGNTYWVQMFTD